MNPSLRNQFVSLVLIVAAITISFFTSMPNDKIEETTDATEFSVSNALSHLKVISQKPHYTGSQQHTVVRDYIVEELEKMGLTVEIQEQVGVNLKWRAATNNRNILAKIEGYEKGKALLLLSHYDSNPHSALGASDAGSGVVAILEGIRAYLANGITPKNDIIICITDAEELGLLGAHAFVNHHPWAKDIGLVLNLEARGSGGPSYMLMEINGGNENLIKAFSKTKTKYPVASSLLYSIYKMLPNDTDLTVFREDGDIDGLNFAFIDDHYDYHTVQDSYERMDIGSLKHQADYLMAGIDYFSGSDLTRLKSDKDFVYFNFPGVGMLFYPFSWVVPVFWICLGLFIILVLVGKRKRKLTFRGMFGGFIPLLLSLVISGLLTVYGWKLINWIYPQYQDILQGFTYNGISYIAAFVALTLALSLFFYSKFYKKTSPQDLVIAPLVLWLLLNGFVSYYLLGAGFFILPVIVMLIQLSLFIFSRSTAKRILLFTLLSLPVLAIFVPLIQMLPIGLGLGMLAASAVFTVLLFGAMSPLFQRYVGHKRFAKLGLLIALFFLIQASLNSGYNEENKKPNSIIYLLDADENKAFWATYNHATDDFTSQFLGEEPISGSYDANTTASKYKTKIKWHKPTKVRTIAKPEIQVIADTVVGNSRIVQLSVKSLRNANKIEILTNETIHFESMVINGEAVKMEGGYDISGGTVMSYFLTDPDEKLELKMTVPEGQKFDIDILEAKFDLFSNPEFEITPRESYMIPTPFVLNDATVIKTNLKF